MPVGKTVYEVDSAVMIGGKHAVSLDPHRKHDDSEKEEFEENEAKHR
jgi:hypothetical protein